MEHEHDFGVSGGYGDPLGRPVDAALLARFIGAAFDGCTSCQATDLTLIVSDPPTCARLVELACVATAQLFGGLPSSMTDPTAPGVSSVEFRQLARAGLDKHNDELFAACAQMTPAQRRAAANTATDQLIGLLAGTAAAQLNGDAAQD